MPQVGDTASRTRTVQREDIARFTELTGDRNPLHYDEEAAARSRFGGIIVQLTAEVEVLETRTDKPITHLRTTITTGDGTVVLDGTALVWTEPL